MYDDGQSEISAIREEMISTYEIPPLDMIAWGRITWHSIPISYKDLKANKI